MLTGLVFTVVFMLGFLYLSIFKKHPLINTAIFFLATGCLVAYFKTGLDGLVYVLVAMIAVCGYELYEMTKVRKW